MSTAGPCGSPGCQRTAIQWKTDKAGAWESLVLGTDGKPLWRCSQHLGDLGESHGGLEAHLAPSSKLEIWEAELADVDLDKAVLRNLVFHGGSLSGASLIEASIEGVTFQGVDLDRADFRRACLNSVTFVACHKARSVSFSHAHFERTEFSQCGTPSRQVPAEDEGEGERTSGLDQATFRHASLSDVSFMECSIEEACFEAARLLKTTFRQCRHDNSTFSNLRAEGTTFKGAAPKDLASMKRCVLADAIFVVHGNAPVFKDVDLSGSDFQRASFTRTQPDGDLVAFEDAALVNVNFASCGLSGVRLTSSHDGARAPSCDFSNADLERTIFSGMVLTGGIFDGAHLNGTQFVRQPVSSGDKESRKTILRTTRFDNAELTDVRFEHADAGYAFIRASRLVNCTLESVQLKGADLSSSDLGKCTLTDVEFEDASLSGIGFRGCQLKQVSFKDADLRNSAFRASIRDDSGNMTHSRPRGLGEGCSFQGANLSDALFEGLELKEPDFRQAILEGTCLKGLCLEQPDFRKSRLVGVNLTLARVTGGRFERAQLQECNLLGASFDGCDFSSADLSGSYSADRSSPRDAGVAEDGAGVDCRHSWKRWECPAAPKDGESLGHFVLSWWKKTDDGEEELPGSVKFVDCLFPLAILRSCVLIGACFEVSQRESAGIPKKSAKMLCRANLEYADLRGAILDRVDAGLASFRGALLGDRGGLKPKGDAAISLAWAPIAPASLADAVLAGASFEGADLSKCNLQGADLSESCLDNAQMSRAQVGGCTFSGARLYGVGGFDKIDFTTGQNDATKAPGFQYALIQGTQVPTDERSNLEQDFVNWVNGPPNTAPQDRRLSWVAWKNNFASLGFYDLQSECFRQERAADGWRWLHDRGSVFQAVMFSVLLIGLLVLLRLSLVAASWPMIAKAVVVLVAAGGIRGFAYLNHKFKLARVALTSLMDLIYGFGERPQQVLLNAFSSILVFTGAYWISGSAYWISGSVEETVGSSSVTVTDPLDLWYFSVVTFTTLGYGDLHPVGGARVFAEVEAVMGLVMAALFVLALARRTAGR